MKYTHIVIHYAEIGTKGRNRPFFEKKLQENIQKSLKRDSIPFESVDREYGRILVKLSDNTSLDEIKTPMNNIFGIANFSPAKRIELDIKNIEKESINTLKEKDFRSFKIETKRSNKEFSLNSMEINEKVGQAVVDSLEKQVDLDNPDLTLYIEITKDSAYLYSEKLEGPGGLPVGVSSKSITLLSGGIDSPVAAYLTNKRGVENIFIHFHSYPYTNRASIDKAKRVVEILNKYQYESKLYLVPFAEIQKEILDNAPPAVRILLYRRFMFRIAEKIAQKENAPVLTTGESIGQVGSQTLENIRSVSESISLPVLRPLTGFDKKDIIELSKKIGTYEVSIEPCQDACTWFMPDNPETKSTVQQIKKAEENLDLKELVDTGVNAIEEELIR